MAIEIKYPIGVLSDTAFKQLDYRVMWHAFSIHNEIGNLWDEIDYKSKLLERCVSDGLSAVAETMVAIRYKDFLKTYFIDLLIEGAVYELKAKTSIVAADQSQTINYLFLTNTQHGKIINFRPESLEWRFVSTTLTFQQRTKYTLHTENWTQRKDNYPLVDLISELLNEWGAYLDLHLYKEAILFFFGISPDDPQKRFCVITPESLLHVSGLSRNKPSYRKNLQKYLNASSAQYLDWINFDQNQIEIHTLHKIILPSNHSA